MDFSRISKDAAKRVVDTVKASLGSISISDNDEVKLPLSQYQEWFDILVKGDTDSATNFLKNASEPERHVLCNSVFEFEELDGFEELEVHITKVNLPFHVAFCSGSEKLAELMIQHGVDIFAISLGNNVLHSACIMAFNSPEMEEDICKTILWLSKELPQDDFTKLLFQENGDGLYPLEMAAQQGCLKIFRTLFETKGHVEHEIYRGVGIYRSHNITEYEVGDRHTKSPINMLAYLDVKKLDDPETAHIVLSPLISGWIDKKIKSNIPLLIIWSLLRALFVAVFIVLDMDVSWLEAKVKNNITTDDAICPQLAFISLYPYEISVLSLFLFTFSLAIFTVYIIEAVENRRKRLYLKRLDLNGKKDTIASIIFYRVEQAILVVAIMLTTIESFESLASGLQISSISRLITDISRSVIPVLCLWSVCYFLQLLPSIGSSIISIQSMLVDMARFMLLFVIILLPFIHVFQSFALINSNQGCVEEFKNTFVTSYTLFKMMLNIYDPSNGSIGSAYQNLGILYILHILYIFMIGVMLINFLIAMMSKKAADVADNEKVLLKLNQLAIVVLLEDRIFCIPKISKYLYKHLRKLSFYCANDQIYLQSAVRRNLKE